MKFLVITRHSIMRPSSRVQLPGGEPRSGGKLVVPGPSGRVHAWDEIWLGLHWPQLVAADLETLGTLWGRERGDGFTVEPLDEEALAAMPVVEAARKREAAEMEVERDMMQRLRARWNARTTTEKDELIRRQGGMVGFAQ